MADRCWPIKVAVLTIWSIVPVIVIGAVNLQISGNTEVAKAFKLVCSSPLIYLGTAYYIFYRSPTPGDVGRRVITIGYFHNDTTPCHYRGSYQIPYPFGCEDNGKRGYITINVTTGTNLTEHDKYWRCETLVDTRAEKNNEVHVFIYDPVKTVQIVAEDGTTLTSPVIISEANTNTKLLCTTGPTGSRPEIQLTWWKEGTPDQQITSGVIAFSGQQLTGEHVTARSTLNVANRSFDGVSVFCKASLNGGDTQSDKVLLSVTLLTAVQAEATRTWYLWVVGVCAVVLLILMVMLVVMPYIMWRNRVILVMKIVHFFQGYEDDDEREWDAFVSYKADQVDEAFVLNTLYPKLEKEMGFKLHLHFKDFVPGDSIANNIIRAVKSSRRTILLVTPNFVKSEFTKFEYQVAQDEMLKYRHRIIPILLEDITDVRDNMDHNLKHILDSVTYIEWPGTENEKKLNRFWKRLELSLPKKRSEDRKSAAMAAPEDIEVSVITDQRSNEIESQFELKETEPIRMSNGTTIFDDGEVYDTINDDDVKTQVLKKNKMNSQNGGDNIGNGNHCVNESYC